MKWARSSVVECLLCKEEVRGSNPRGSTKEKMKKYSQIKVCRGILNTKYWWVLIIVLVIVVIGLGVFFFCRNKKPQVTINNKTFNVEVALTDAQREKGLSGRTELDANSGMLFVFPKSDIETFWMKETKIPLDIIWIDDSKIVEMTTLDPQIGTDIPSYTPKNKANYVLEINAGMASEDNIKVGDSVKIKY